MQFNNVLRLNSIQFLAIGLTIAFYTTNSRWQQRGHHVKTDNISVVVILLCCIFKSNWLFH